ncbi:MAG: LacI family DNA-binding transcriptional regulator [Shinella sp.]|nr:LacI family DNA-binding transcriptional regulator [Shinella sp.]
MTDGNRRGRQVTLMDVAREAEVSRATASLVIRKSPLVGAKTRERVEAAIERLGYVYNMGAARMRAERSRTVGVIVPTLSNPFFAELLSGIEETIDAAGMVVLLANSGESVERQAGVVRRMREHGVDGLILTPSAGTAVEFLNHIAEWRMPLVQALRHLSPDADYAGTDYAAGMQQAVDYLASLGHRRVVFLAGGPVHAAYRERVEGFRRAMLSHGFDPENIIDLPFKLAEVAKAAPRIFEQGNPPTAAICFNDVFALGLSAGLYDLGVSVGRDFSIVGFDDVTEAEAIRPRLTSVSTDPALIGRNAARLLLERLDDPERPARAIVSETVLNIRQSCGPAPAAVEVPATINR